MSKTIKLATLLYARCSRSMEVIPGLTVGTTDGTVRSACRPVASASSEAKLSLIAIALDELLTGTGKTKGGSFAFARLEDGNVYAEFHNPAFPSCNRAVVLKDGNIQATSLLSEEHIAMLLLVHALVNGSNEEFCRIFTECVSQYSKTGRIERNSAFLLCDSYYFGNMKKQGLHTITFENVPEATIEAYVRSSSPKVIQELKGTTASRPEKVSIRKAEPKPKKAEGDLFHFMEECRNGDYQVDYEWDASQEAYLQSPSSLDGYIPNEQFRAIVKKIKFRTDRILSRLKGLDLSKGRDRVSAIGQDYINLTLCGKPGTGKTKLAYMLASATGLPIYTVSNSHNTDEDEYEGKTKMIDGRAVSVETDTLRCVEHGGILLLEEINLVNAAVAMGALGQLAEFPFLIKKFGYEPLHRHPLCIIISTMNTGTAGSKSMSQPFANRFKQSFVLNDPSKDDFIRILMNTGAGRDVCRWVYDCYERITSCIEEDNGMADVESILLSLSVRSCIGAIENIQEGMEPRLAVTNSIIGKIAEQDRDVAENCRKVLSSMREPDFEEE